MAWIRKKGKVWYAEWRQGGKQVTQPVSLKKSVALEFLDELRERLDRQRVGLGPGDQTVAQWMADHLSRLGARMAAGDLKPSSVVRARQAFGHLEGWLEARRPEIRRLSQLVPSVLQDYRLHRARTAKSSTVNTEMALLSPAFKASMNDGSIRRSPISALRKLKERDSRAPRPLALEEARAFIAAASPELLPYAIGYIYTGARRNELFEVGWPDVDFESRTLVIQNIKTHRDNRDRAREIPMQPKVARLLNKMPKEGAGPWPRVPDETLRRWVRQAAVRAKLKPPAPTVHDLRHTHATLLKTAGIDVLAIKLLMGHRRLETTERYVHTDLEYLRRATRKLRI